MGNWRRISGKHFEVIDEKDVDEKASETWGDSSVLIGEKEIEALRAGKVLFNFDGEYGLFVYYSNEGEKR